jgi:hypothetical protein
MLPAEFADLEPFAATWCLATERERWERRLTSTMAELQTFYDACFPRYEDAVSYLDQFTLEALPDEAVHLLRLLYSLALVSYAIEVWQQPLPVDIGAARIDRIKEPSL